MRCPAPAQLSLAAWLAYYRRQRLAGKLNLLFLSLFVVLLLNVLAVFVSLSIVYASNAALWKLERFESRVGAIERTLPRFRISHERGDALVVVEIVIKTRLPSISLSSATCASATTAPHA